MVFLSRRFGCWRHCRLLGATWLFRLLSLPITRDVTLSRPPRSSNRSSARKTRTVSPIICCTTRTKKRKNEKRKKINVKQIGQLEYSTNKSHKHEGGRKKRVTGGSNAFCCCGWCFVFAILFSLFFLLQKSRVQIRASTSEKYETRQIQKPREAGGSVFVSFVSFQ